MKKKSIPEIEAQVAKLAEFLAVLPDGEEVTWLRVEAETSIKMDNSGRSLARRALRRIKRPYEPVRATGVRLSAPDSALTILRGRFIRIDGAVRGAEKTQKELQARHLPQMTPDEQRKMLLVGGLFGAIRTVAMETKVALLKD